MPQTNEKAFESYVEEILLTRAGWKTGSVAEWDEARALSPARIFSLLEETQEQLWSQMRALHACSMRS